MKTIITILIAATIPAVWLPVFAQDHMAHAQGMSQSTMSMMMPLQEQMQAMQQKMDKIQATKDPEERQRLMSEHMQAMHQAVSMMGMHGMMQHPGMHAGTGEGPTNSAQGPMQECMDDTAQCKQMNQLADRQQGMEQRMNMMQMMMQQMLEHEAASEEEEDK